MLLKSEGLVLQAIKYGDNSLITKLLTKEKGVLSLISSRSKKNKNQVFQSPFALVHTVCYFKSSQNIHRLKEIQFHPEFIDDQGHPIKNALRYFMAELLNQIVREEEENIRLYEFVKQTCLLLNHSRGVSPSFLIEFLAALTEPLGFYPRLNQSTGYFDLLSAEFLPSQPSLNPCLNREDSALFYALFQQKHDFNRLQRKQLVNHLLSYYSVQLDQKIKLKSKEVLDLIFD